MCRMRGGVEVLCLCGGMYVFHGGDVLCECECECECVVCAG